MAVAETRHIHLNAAFLSGSGQKKEIGTAVAVLPIVSNASPGLFGEKGGASYHGENLDVADIGIGWARHEKTSLMLKERIGVIILKA